MSALLRTALLVSAAAVVSAWWADEPTRTRNKEPPYPYPKDRKYNTVNQVDGPVPGKINVHLVPHTHDDTGWQVTVDQYFFSEVYYVVDTVVDQLVKDPKRHFIYVETGFFARWWDEQPDERRNVTKALVKSGQLEFINGAWCMHDEASPFYVEMVDQTTRGHQFLKKNFGETAIPRGTWQIDPFGHSNTQAWLLGAEAGMESLFWGRTDYQDLNYRFTYEAQQHNQWPEWVWEGSQSLGKSAVVFSGQLTTHNYGAPINWDGDGGAVQDNPSRHDYNLDQMIDQFVAAALQLNNITKLNHQLWPCGSDFQYQNADHWFHNLDKIMHYVNLNATRGGPVVAFYSTPTHYADMKHAETLKSHTTWEVRSDDIFPLADNAHAYWSGYFTSRPSLKRQVRFASNFLNAARQMEVITGVTAAEVDTPTERPSPPVGTSWTDSMEGAIGVATHHDGMSGTERQDVSNDYSQRISEGHFEVEAGVALALKKLTGIKGDIGHCNCNAAGNCLNMSMCAYTTGVDEFTVIAWNPLAQNSTSWLRIPVLGAAWSVTNLATHAPVSSQAIVIDNRTRQLPLLYINKFGKNAQQISEEEASLSNKASHVLTFPAVLPPVGYATFTAKKESSTSSSASSDATTTVAASVVSNGIYAITLDQVKGSITSVKNIASGAEVALNLTWGWYESNTGDHLSSQPSGAYMFRPAQQHTWECDKSTQPTLHVSTGPLVTEIKQHFADWATHTIRLTKNSPYIEIEWTAGPIPMFEYTGHIEPPKPPTTKVLTGTWDYSLNGFFDSYTIAESKDGAFTVQSHKPGTGWKTATGTVSSAGALHVKFDNGVQNQGHMDSSWTNMIWQDGSYWTRHGAKPPHNAGPKIGKEVVLKFNSDIMSHGTFYTDSNGREMVKRQRNARGPSYPPYVVGEPVAGNYYPVNSMMSIDDGRTEMAVVTDVSMGGSSMADGSLELMVHRRCQADDSRGVQEPLNETMCGCNDIGAQPGKMGAHGSEGDGGCLCEGLTMRGSMWLVVDTMHNAHASRRNLIEQLNFGPTLAFSKDTPVHPTLSGIAGELPQNIKMTTISTNYKDWNDGRAILRFAHLFQVDEHPTLSQPVTFSLASIFAKVGLKVTSATETMLTANQPRKQWEAKKKMWDVVEVVERGVSDYPQDERRFFDENDAAMTVTMNAMEVKTFLVTLG